MSGNDRVIRPISLIELERRWTTVRSRLGERSIDALVMQNTNDWLGGYVKYFTDVPANNGYPRTVIFPADDWMTVIEMGPFDGIQTPAGKDPSHCGVGRILHTPSFPSIAYTHRYDAELAVAEIKRAGFKTVGLVGAGAMAHDFVTALRSALDHVTFVDATDLVDEIKAVKSAEEIECIQQACAMQDEVFSAVAGRIRPGLRDIDITAMAQQEALVRGSEQGIFLGGSAKVGVRSPFLPRHFQGRQLEQGDHLSILIEVNGPGGFYVEIARTLVLGRASNELLDGFEAVRAAQAHTLAMLRPGARPADIVASHNEFMRSNGLPTEARLYAHGQGYDMVERPLIRHDETMPLKAGMCLAVHPGYETPQIFAVICDNYMIEDHGAGDCLHKTEKRIFEV